VAVAVGTGQYTREELLAENPDALFDDLSEVDRVVATILGRA
jgi:hypothetical protein